MALSSSSNSTPGPGEHPATFVNHNGILHAAGQALLTADNRGFRYGDGLFETMLVRKGSIRLGGYHFDRLLAGMHFLKFNIPSFFIDSLTEQVLQLCERNGHLASGAARVRLVIFRGDSPFDAADPTPNYIIQSWPLPAAQDLNRDGLSLGIFPDGRKACDLLANLKSNNYLLYTLAARYARENQLDDCLILNSRDRLADTTIANLFYVRNGRIYTPPLSEGGVAGVMRRHLLDVLPRAGYTVEQHPITIDDLLTADEIFLTNALKGIRWVRSLQQHSFMSRLSSDIHKKLIEPL